MATTTFNTRISLKYDTYAQWVEKDPQLLVGEVAVVVVPAETGAVAKEPAVLFKVGDGAHKFSELQFTAGLAADVYDWAKAASKPTYSANEIDGLSDYISGEIQDTDTQYKLEVDADNSRKFHLYSQAKGTSTWNLVSTITIPDETVYTLAEGTANGTVKFNGEDVKVHGLGTAAYKDEGAFDAAGAATKALEDAKTYADGKDAAIAAAKKAGDDAQTAVDALGERVGALPEGATATTVVGYVDEKIGKIPAQTDYTVTVTPSTPDGVAKRYNIKQTATNLDVNIDIPKDMVVESGTVETKAEAGVWGEAGTYLHLVLANATEDNIYINVGSLIEYVTSGSKVGDQIVIDVSADHKVTATLTEGSVTLAQLHADVQSAIGKAHSHTNKAELDKIVTGDKAKWDAAEQKAHEHDNKTILDTISQDKVGAWDGAVAKQHEHANKTVLDGISAEKVADWDSKAAGNHEHDITELKQSSGYIVFNCGSASVNI
jgi:hypothetical protein